MNQKVDIFGKINDIYNIEAWIMRLFYKMIILQISENSLLLLDLPISQFVFYHCKQIFSESKYCFIQSLVLKNQMCWYFLGTMRCTFTLIGSIQSLPIR